MWKQDNDPQKISNSHHQLVMSMVDSVLESDQQLELEYGNGCDQASMGKDNFMNSYQERYKGYPPVNRNVPNNLNKMNAIYNCDKLVGGTVDPNRILEESKLRPDAPIFNSQTNVMSNQMTSLPNRKMMGPNNYLQHNQFNVDVTNNLNNMFLPHTTALQSALQSDQLSRQLEPQFQFYQPQLDIATFQRIQNYEMLQRQHQQVRCLQQYPYIQPLQKQPQWVNNDDIKETMANWYHYQQGTNQLIGTQMNQSSKIIIENTMENNELSLKSELKLNSRRHADLNRTTDGGNSNYQHQRRFPSVQSRGRRLSSSSGYSNRVCNHTSVSNGYCNFCKKNGEPMDFYSSHTLKSGDKTVCPILRECICSLCNVKGHTMSHCDLNKKKDTVLKMINKHNSMKI